jgi:hypothetical protein
LDGRRLASEGEEFLLWDVRRQQLLPPGAPQEEGSGAGLAFRVWPGFDWAAWSDWAKLSLYRLRRAKLVDELRGKGFRITGFSFAPCGGAIAIAEGNGGMARIWDVYTGRLVREVDTRAQAGTISWLVFTPDGTTLATGDGPCRMHLWEAATGRHLATIEDANGQREEDPHGRWHSCMAADGKTLFASSGGEILVWDLANRKAAGVFQEDEGFAGGSYRLPISVSPDGRLLAQFDSDDLLHLWEMASGRVAYSFGEEYSSVAFAPDGRRLATGCEEDGSILVWDLVELLLAEQRRADEADPREMERAWADLASADAPRAYQAIGLLASSGESTLDLLGQRLRPITDAKTHEAAAWLAQLDSPEFEVRSRAAQRLGELRDAALPLLERAREKRPPLEAWRRLEGLRGTLDPRSPESLREVRAVQVLEYIGTDEARRLLHRLAGGLPQARLTREAQGALGRLNRRPPP